MSESERDLHLVEKQILNQLRTFGATDNLVVAFSGGVDSKVLLHVCWKLQTAGLIQKLSAIHVDHGIQDMSTAWKQQCQADCETYQIACQTHSLELDSQTSESAARDGRYRVFEQVVTSDQVLLLAHHQNDQAETLLFRLLRGCGIAGASGMPVIRKLASARLLRPMLNLSRKDIEEYAATNNLQWIEDPSNQSDDYSRNYLRNRVVPVLEKKWPAFAKTFARFADLATEQNQLLSELAEEDIKKVENAHGDLQIETLIALSSARQKNLLHQWGVKKLANAPSSNEINQVLKQLPAALEGAQINIDFADKRIRSYSGRLLIVSKKVPDSNFTAANWENLDVPLTLDNGVTLKASRSKELGLRIPNATEVVTVVARQGGEKVLPDFRSKSTSLKKVYQELAVPPWQREWLPVVYYDNKIAAVPGVFVEQNFLSQPGESSLFISLAEE